MAKVKIAVAQNSEEVDRVMWTHLTRAEARAQARNLFSQVAAKSSVDNRSQIKDLFVQGEASQNPGLNVESKEKTASQALHRPASLHELLGLPEIKEPKKKEKVASAVEALAAHLEDPNGVYERYPELKKVAASRVRPDLRPRAPSTSVTGQSTPVKSGLSGGSA